MLYALNNPIRYIDPTGLTVRNVARAIIREVEPKSDVVRGIVAAAIFKLLIKSV